MNITYDHDKGGDPRHHQDVQKGQQSFPSFGFDYHRYDLWLLVTVRTRQVLIFFNFGKLFGFLFGKTLIDVIVAFNTGTKTHFLSRNSLDFGISKMWILWKLRFLKGEFCENWDFQYVNFWIKCGFLPQCGILVKWECMYLKVWNVVEEEQVVASDG